jgi:hypothetical protein
MNIEIHEQNGIKIAEIISGEIEINITQDALDLMADCDYLGARRIIINKENLLPEFFDLKTGLAGEILQKFVNYQIQLAIVGDFSKYTSKSLKDFIFESNKTGRINFVSSVEEAKVKLSGNN